MYDLILCAFSPNAERTLDSSLLPFEGLRLQVDQLLRL